ncbi:hypothetical protein [Paenibacillus harenae]|uniref:DUF2530 domain-containing protein n=1 Tax=Paenibacillus harenae TaxID=306543 RepID=A0ABT9UBH2_PAEHA|nr:hypothetical protein [Paenibacillus harenae]MDQ0063872.1 hypothetical protein [Paenibacillus harenae]MDQ0116348.1 hypothetical protein [Paenibacillus harenae]
MTTKTASISHAQPTKSDVKRLVKAMTAIAWGILGIGFLLCLVNLSHFSDQNVGLMVGIGFLIGSVHIYVIGTAIGLVHARLHQDQTTNDHHDPQA